MKKVVLILSGLVCSSFSHASALYFYEIGTEDVGLAGAGQAARAQDASTIVTNPAGMTRLPDHMFTGGMQVMGGDISYQLNDENGRSSPGNVMNLFPGASGFYAQKSMMISMPAWVYTVITAQASILATGPEIV